MNNQEPPMDWIKDAAVIGSVAYGAEKVLKVFRLWKQASRQEKGLTIKNGEYSSLLKTLGRIEGRIDHVVQRVEAIESRLST